MTRKKNIKNNIKLEFEGKDRIFLCNNAAPDIGGTFLDWENERDLIENLFAPKQFTKWKLYDSEGLKTPKQMTTECNFIFKGDNLIVMHSLVEVFAGKVDLIYIDPPYNTGAENFKYNDSLPAESWLTFMKNRLEIASKLLSKTGVVMVHCSFHRFAYLKVLMMEIFNRHLCDFHIQVRHPDRLLTGDKEFNDIIEYIMIFTMDSNKKMPVLEIEKTIDEYIYEVVIKENEIPHEIIDCDNKKVEVFLPYQYAVNILKPNENQLKKISVRGTIREKNSSGRFYVKYLEKLKGLPPETLFRVPGIGDDDLGFRYFYSAPVGRKNGGYYQGMPQSSRVTRKPFPNFLNFEKEFNNMSAQGDVSFRNGKKPEELMHFLISNFTEHKSLILDYHLGSGTTSAVAHKMGRRYIGIENMDFIGDITLRRMLNVINGDQSGVSKLLDWHGGGAFIYCELLTENQLYIDKIKKAQTFEELMEIYNILKSNMLCANELNFEIHIPDLEEFRNLLGSRINKCILYKNYSVEDQSDLKNESDVLLNQEFYNL